jgi:hypothetical protein
MMRVYEPSVGSTRNPLAWETYKTIRDEASGIAVEIRRAPLDQKPGSFVYSLQVGGHQRADTRLGKPEKTTPYIPVRYDFEHGDKPVLRHPVDRIIASMVTEALLSIEEAQSNGERYPGANRVESPPVRGRLR